MHPHTLFRSIAPSVIGDNLLYSLCEAIPRLGLKARKIVLDVCQTLRSTEDERRTLVEDLKEIIRDIRVRDQDPFFGKDIPEALVHVSSFPIYRSFISMVVRNEIIDQFGGAEEAIKEGFTKEWRATDKARDEEIRISYQVLDQDNFAPAEYTVFYPLTPWWSSYAKNLVGRFSARLEKMGVIFPQVQRRKNMSRDTCRKLADTGYQCKNWTDLRTLDLELHCYRTGERITGHCELRMAWKFNELKPRLYYCIGGSAYWISRHIKKLAVALMESVDSTKLTRRMHPEDIMYNLTDDDWLALWDLSSFTSTLSELKHFLYYLVKNLEDDMRVQQNPLRIFDYQLGIIEVTADKLLMEYNVEVNQNSAYTIDRLMQKIFGASLEDEEIPMLSKNSGLLGIQGNIGFSTAHHGFHMEAAINRGTGCGVGDDAMGAIRENPESRLIPHLQLIGDLATEKVTILPPLQPGEEQIAKFVKRRLTRSTEGITMGILYAFPSLASAFGLQDEYHTMMTEDRSEQIAKFCSQVGAFFWDIHATGYLEETEYTLIVQTLGSVYRKFRLCVDGSLPGKKHPEFHDGMMFAVPPLRFDFSSFDWSEYLWDSTSEKMALLPMTLGDLPIPPYEEGLWFQATECATLNVLEDVGCIRKARMVSEWVEVSVTNRRLFRSFLSSSHRVYDCQYLNHVPSWINQIVYTYDDVPYMPVV